MRFQRLLKVVDPAVWRYWVPLGWEKARGVDFLRSIEPQEVGLDPLLAVHSSPSGNKYLVRALRAMSIGPSHSILDIGCGKGSAMRVMLRFPFTRVDGVEMSETIAGIARENFKTLGVHPLRWHVFAVDATALGEELDIYSHFYLYNPFTSPVMKVVAQNLRRSLERRPRDITVIYNNPVCRADIEDTCAFDLERQFDADWGHKIAVYRSRIPAS